MTTSSATIRSRGLAILFAAAAAVALTGCSALGLGGGATGDSSPTPTATPTDGIVTDVSTIAVGDCVNGSANQGEVSTVKKVDCSEPHDSEAYATITMDDGAFPGNDAFKASAETDCSTQFNSFVGVDYGKSKLSFYYYYPTADSWAQGDREILCLIVDPKGKVSTSLAGAAR